MKQYATHVQRLLKVHIGWTYKIGIAIIIFALLYGCLNLCKMIKEWVEGGGVICILFVMENVWHMQIMKRYKAHRETV